MAGRPLAALILSLAFTFPVHAQTPSVVAQGQPAWNKLNAQQRTALAPLLKEWNTFSDARKLKWLGIAARYRDMTAIEQARMQDRMRDWIELTPAQREQARVQYKKLRAVPVEARKELSQKWQEYEALPLEEKERLKASKLVVMVASQSGPVAVPYPAGIASPAPKPLLTTPPVQKTRQKLGGSAPANSEPK